MGFHGLPERCMYRLILTRHLLVGLRDLICGATTRVADGVARALSALPGESIPWKHNRHGLGRSPTTTHVDDSRVHVCM
jgi:hypothetical protein